MTRSLKARALQWLAQREQSRVELRRKLLRAALADDAATEAGDSAAVAADASTAEARVEALLDWLEAHRFLSPERFVESRVHARAARFGNLRIRQELKQHQVALSADAAQALADSELGRACEVRQRKYGAPPSNAAERARQARFLASRGFTPEVIGRALRQAVRPDDDEDGSAA
jgi:regulatory protein